MPRIVFVLATLLIPVQALGAVPTVDEWIRLSTVDAPRISPDGRFVAYLVQEVDENDDTYEREIWIASTETGERFQLTDAKGSSWSPQWSPNGDRLAFLSTREGGPQVYMAAFPKGAAVPLTRMKNGVDSFQWSPDGKRIALTTSEIVTRTQAEEPREYHVVGNDPAFSSSLWVFEVPATATAVEPERLTDAADFAVDDIAWSPDSKRIAFPANQYGDPYPFSTYDIYVLTLGEKHARKIVNGGGPEFFPVWSPDGREIAYKTFVRSPADEYHTYSIGYIAVVPADGGITRVLTEQFDENVTPLAWAPEGIYFAARQRTYQHLFRLNPETRATSRISEPYGSVNFGFSFSKDFRQMAFVGADAKRYQEIYVSALGQPFRPKRLTRSGDQLGKWKLATREIVQWKSKDGTPIEGILVKPADFDPAKKHPLVVIIHTGPLEVDQATITRDLPYPAELFAAKGAVVLRPNYRGSTGYGARFRALLVRKLGIPEVEDVVSGVDHLIQQGFVDRDRVGAMGWSHGGYIAAMISASSDRFRAVSVGQGISDWRIFYTLGAGATVKPDYLQATPWDDPEYYRSTSPLTYVKRARTPTLIQHGDADGIAPIASAYELYRALKDQGVPVEMIVYRGAGHLPSGLRQTRAVVEQNLEWFDQWLWKEGAGHRAPPASASTLSGARDRSRGRGGAL